MLFLGVESPGKSRAINLENFVLLVAPIIGASGRARAKIEEFQGTATSISERLMGGVVNTV